MAVHLRRARPALTRRGISRQANRMTEKMHTSWAQIALLWVAGLLAAAQFGKISLAFPAMAEIYPLPEPVLAICITAVSIAGMTLGAVAGFGIARVGAKTALVGALIFAGILSLVQTLLPPFSVMVFLRGLEGLTHLAIVVAAPVLMINVSAKKDQPITMAIWASFFGVSFAGTAAIMPALIETVTYPGVWMLHGAAMIFIAALSALMLSPLPRAHAPWEGYVSLHKRIYSNPALIAPGLGFFCHTLIFVALLSFLPAYSVGRFDTALVASLYPLIALAGTFLAGFLSRSIAPLTVIRWSYLLSVIALLVILLVPETARPYAAGVAFILVGLAPGASFAAIPALNLTPEAQSQSGGALAQLGNLGTGLGSPIFALALTVGGLAGLVILAALISLAGASLMVWSQSRLAAR